MLSGGRAFEHNNQKMKKSRSNTTMYAPQK